MSEFLVLDDVKTHFDLGNKAFSRTSKGVVKAVDGISLSIHEGEILGHLTPALRFDVSWETTNWA